jgi:hypothetical protein
MAIGLTPAWKEFAFECIIPEANPQVGDTRQ